MMFHLDWFGLFWLVVVIFDCFSWFWLFLVEFDLFSYVSFDCFWSFLVFKLFSITFGLSDRPKALSRVWSMYSVISGHLWPFSFGSDLVEFNHVSFRYIGSFLIKCSQIRTLWLFLVVLVFSVTFHADLSRSFQSFQVVFHQVWLFLIV